MYFPCKRLSVIALTTSLACLFSTTLLAQLDASLLEGLSARTLGPAAVSGRITSIDAVASNPNHIVIGAATGGVWISENGGLTWIPVFDEQPVASIGAVAINQQNPDIIWVGTGEGNVRNSTSIGDGMFKSIDGGKSWKRAGLKGTERINRIALHPKNPDIAYAAALGTLWGENQRRGIFKTDGRRHNLGESSLRRPKDRRNRYQARPIQPGQVVRQPVATPPLAVLFQVGRAGFRNVHFMGCRPNVEAKNRGRRSARR